MQALEISFYVLVTIACLLSVVTDVVELLQKKKKGK